MAEQDRAGHAKATCTLDLSGVTSRELEVLRLLCEGFCAAEIARRLNRSVETIKSHRRSLGRKLGVTNKVELVRIAIQAGVIDLMSAKGQSSAAERSECPVVWAFDHSVMPMAIADESRLLRFMNPAFCRLFQLDECKQGVVRIDELIPPSPQLHVDAGEARINPAEGVYKSSRVLKIGDAFVRCEVLITQAKSDDSHQSSFMVVIPSVKKVGLPGAADASSTPASTVCSDASDVNDYQSRRCAEARLQEIVAGTNHGAGQCSFRTIVRSMARAVDTKYAFISEFDPNAEHTARTLAIWIGDRIGENFEHNIENGPCGPTPFVEPRVFASGVAELFALDPRLAEYEFESMITVPLVSSDGRPIGVAAVMDVRPRPDFYGVAPIVGVFASRAMAEMERRNTKHELKILERRYSSLAEMIPFGVFRHDLITGDTSLNTRGCELLGLDAAAVSREGWSCNVHPDDRVRVRNAWELAVSRREPFQSVHNFLRPDGGVLRCRVEAAPEVGQTGDYIGYIGSIHPV